MVTLPTVPTFPNTPEVRPLPSPDITRLPWYYEPVRLPTRPDLSLTGVPLIQRTIVPGLPCCFENPLAACRHHYPGRIRVPMLSFNGFSDGGFPLADRGSAPATCVFGACTVFTCVELSTLRHGITARKLAEWLNHPFTPRASTISLPPPPPRLLPAGTTKLPGGSRTHGTHKTFPRRTPAAQASAVFLDSKSRPC